MEGSSVAEPRLVDREAIRELLYAYCRACDINDPEAVAACFTADCRADYGPDAREPGAEARRAQAEEDLALFAATSHLLGNVAIEFEGADRARAVSVVHAWHRPRRGEPWSLHARYEDVVVRAPGGWLIDERRLLVAGTEPRQDGRRFNPLPRAD
ncbi:MAG: nuclear transport factor 2 family protein [Actinobacteria bacterium]|nr:nuclear transport factor 2 family protein [Actinomycetota bacterium]